MRMPLAKPLYMGAGNILLPGRPVCFVRKVSAVGRLYNASTGKETGKYSYDFRSSICRCFATVSAQHLHNK